MYTRESVVLYDDEVCHRELDVYFRIANKAIVEAGLMPEIFCSIEGATEYISVANENVLALVCALREDSLGNRSVKFKAQPLLNSAREVELPIALISGCNFASHYVDVDSGDIVLPKQPIENIAPRLGSWLSGFIF